MGWKDGKDARKIQPVLEKRDERNLRVASQTLPGVDESGSVSGLRRISAESIMSEPMSDLLTIVAMETMEKTAWLFALPASNSESETQSPAVNARIDFSGGFAGSLIMRMSPPVLNELALNMLETDENRTIFSAERHERLKECLSVICGNLLPVIAGEDAFFKVGAPFIIDDGILEGGRRPGGRKVAGVKLMLEKGFCHLDLYLDYPMRRQPAPRAANPQKSDPVPGVT
jgi:hypothetical protein